MISREWMIAEKQKLKQALILETEQYDLNELKIKSNQPILMKIYQPVGNQYIVFYLLYSARSAIDVFEFEIVKGTRTRNEVKKTPNWFMNYLESGI